jgi:hypothetical protein
MHKNMEYIANEINPQIKKKYGVKYIPIKRNKRKYRIHGEGNGRHKLDMRSEPRAVSGGLQLLGQ